MSCPVIGFDRGERVPGTMLIYDNGNWRLSLTVLSSSLFNRQAHQAGFIAQRNFADALRGFEAISLRCGVITFWATD